MAAHRTVQGRTDESGHRRADQPNVFYMAPVNGGVWKIHRLRRDLEPDLRRPADRLDRRHRRRTVESQHHLRRQRRRTAAAGPLDRRRHLQIHRRRQDLDAPRPPRRPADSADHRRSRAIPTVCSSPSRTSLRPQRGTRHLPLDRRRPDLPEGPLQGREHRRRRFAVRSLERRHVYAVAVGGAPGSVGERRLHGPGSGLFESTDGGKTGSR